MSRHDWHEDAACASVDPEVFFPDRGRPARPALQVCMGCPVRRQCAEHAIPNETHGVWGGLSEKERKALRRTARAELDAA
ncbi:WhiB family transcriptional regulator [Streptomyces niveus]|uniref:WhiB family transcriptional regulator n=1 Tax=Streptomyces niveus TaxID=193462 RepID=UPI0034281022